MSRTATSADPGWRARMRKVMSIVDKVGLGMIYALVIGVLPISAVGFLTRTV